MMRNMALIVAWCDRPEIAETLSFNAQNAALYLSEIIVVNCGGDQAALQGLLKPYRTSLNIRILECQRPEFNKAYALNRGADIAQSAVLTFIDADVIVDEGYFEQASVLLNKNAACVLKSVKESAVKLDDAESSGISVEHVIRISALGARASVVTNRIDFATAGRGGTGIMSLSAETFRLAQGFNSELSTWGWEDVDLLVRVQILVGRALAYVGEGIHLTHDDSKRILKGMTREQSETLNYHRCLLRYLSGNYNGTLCSDAG